MLLKQKALQSCVLQGSGQFDISTGDLQKEIPYVLGVLYVLGVQVALVRAREGKGPASRMEGSPKQTPQTGEIAWKNRL